MGWLFPAFRSTLKGHAVAALMFTYITIAAVTVFLHRYPARHALQLAQFIAPLSCSKFNYPS